MSEKETSLDKFVRIGGHVEKDPLERLRLFCSLAMNMQDWLDVESFFDDVLRDRQAKSNEIINGGGGDCLQLRLGVK